MVGISGDRVCVRSMIWMRPLRISAANWLKLSVIGISRGWMMRRSDGTFPVECFGIVAPAGKDLARHVADIDVLDAILQRSDDRAGDGRRRDLRRRHGLMPLVIDGAREDIDDADSIRLHLAAQRVR